MRQLPLPLPTPAGQDIEQWQHLRLQRGTRYYEAHLQQDLWGEWLLTRRWGCCGDQGGRYLKSHLESLAQGLALLNRTLKQRQRHGYFLAAQEGSEPQ